MKKRRTLFHWHRKIGLAASLFVIILSITGILLNHTEELELDSHYVQSDLLLEWYGIRKPIIKSYAVGDNWLSQVNDKIYFNKKLIKKETPIVTGAVKLENFIALTTNNSLILLSHNGELIERLDATTGIPENIIAIGLNSNSQFFIKTKAVIFQANEDVTEWKQSENKLKKIIWAKTAVLPNHLEHFLDVSFRGEGLSKERVVLDIHSGRIFGKFGILIMDLSAILLLILSLTGSWMYAKRSWAIRKRNLLIKADE